MASMSNDSSTYRAQLIISKLEKLDRDGLLVLRVENELGQEHKRNATEYIVPIEITPRK